MGFLNSINNMVRDWFVQDKLFVGPGAGPAQPGDPAGSIYATGPTFGTWYGAVASLAANYTATSSGTDLPLTTRLDPFGMASGSGTTSFKFTVPRTGKWEIAFTTLMTASNTVTNVGYAGLQLSVGGTLLMQALNSWDVGDAGPGYYHTAAATAVFQCTAGQAITLAGAYTIAPAPVYFGAQQYDTVLTISYFGQ